MKTWFGRLSLRYKLTLAALGVEAAMLAFLIINSVQFTRQELQQQAEHRVREVGETLAAALLAPLSHQDDASVRDVIETLQHDDGLKMIAVRDNGKRIVHQAGTEGTKADFRLLQPVEFSGQRYGEIALVLSGKFIQEARTRYVRQSLIIATLALLLTGLLLAVSSSWVIRRFTLLTRASKQMAQGDLNIKLAGESSDEIGQLIGTFNRMAESVRFNIDRARENEARFHAIADYTHDLEFWLSPEGRL
ncbi:MAG: sensor domain-containing diguanylate cyclase, partial [Hydrogenophilales bacterium 16-62-9]